MPFTADPPLPLWRAPVESPRIVRPFRAAAPYAAGGHRGIDLAASPGQRVGAPCAGRVSFRGAVAGGPPTVTIECGHLRATLQRVAPTVVTGQRLARGQAVGAASDEAIDLSARRADGTYLDPATLLAAASNRPPAGMVAPRRAPRPVLPAPHAQRPARLADRALVIPQWSPVTSGRPAAVVDRVDRPLGLAGGVAMAAVLTAWAGTAVRRRRRSGPATRGASLARVQR